MINVAVLGYGTIGSGVVEVLSRNKEIVKKHAGDEIRVTHVLDLREFPGSPIEEILTHDFEEIAEDDTVDIVVEVMGGTGAAYKFVRKSLELGKHVVTSNKALVAAYGPELLRIAQENRVSFMFEASVGGGIPIIRPLLRCITADEIEEITGILNGTTNFILTKMYQEGSAFEPTLKEAQALGYAEADPTADIEGHDPCRKIAILTSLVLGRFVDFEDIRCTGITGVEEADIAFAKALGRKIKLFGSSFRQNGKVYAEVAPAMIGPEHPLYSVDDVMNAILVRGNMLGDVMFYGAGAGSLPTASAVVSDIIVEARHLEEHIPIPMDPEKMELGDILEAESEYYVRLPKEAAMPFACSRELSLNEYPQYRVYLTGPLTGKQMEELPQAVFMKLR
ncbi:MAG: homoserine dehydrogenase [Parasporobacterium sp.]|nr:homoserine dehydrogenase [Parasporobacterium sp.]